MPNDIFLSLIMITKDNEKDIDRCLRSVQGFVDEIILIDTGSTDKTKEIAEKYTYKIYDFKWTNSFSDAKNYALKWAKGKWILNLDADESISLKDHDKIKKIISNASMNVFGFSLIQRNYTSSIGKFGWVSSKDDSYRESSIATGYVPRRIVRLFRKDSRISFEGAVHDSAEKSILRENKDIEETDIPIHHYGMLNRDNKERTRMYINMELNNLREDDFFQRYQLGCQLHSLGELDEARGWIDKSLAINPKFHLAWLEKGTIYLEKGDIKGALSSLKEAESLGKHEMIYGHLGIAYAQNNDFSNAIEYFRKAIKLNPRNADFYFNLGLALDSANRKTEAGLAFKRAIELNQEYKKLVKIE